MSFELSEEYEIEEYEDDFYQGRIYNNINKMLFVGGVPMYWNWVLRWVISDDTSTKCCLWVVYVLELGIGLGHIRPHDKKCSSWMLYPCIGIRNWIGSNEMVHRLKND